MPTITIDNKEYDFDSLPDAAKAQLQSLKFVDSELQRIQAEAAVLQTARASYSMARNESLATSPLSITSDTLKLG
jgi:hypothetical protein